MRGLLEEDYVLDVGRIEFGGLLEGEELGD